jgi:hypothetical protein
MNELELDSQRESELRRRNSPEEAQKLIGMALDKLERDIPTRGCGLEDVKLLILYVSYRGAPQEKDTLICESILRAIGDRFKNCAGSQLRLIGHTTCGELENEDLMLNKISGVGHNGLSLLALVTNLPIGVGRSWGLRTADEAGEQGREMARDAWVDFSQQTTSKEHLHMKKTLLVLTQGSKVDTPGYEHFLAEGIAHFMGGTREARIMNVIGGASGDGLASKLCRQFYGRLKEHLEFKVLDGESVCGLIPNLSEVSTGAALGTEGLIFGSQHTFHFDAEKEPHYKYIKRIDNENPCAIIPKMIYDLDAQLSKEKGLPPIDRKASDEMISGALAQRSVLIFNPALSRYALAFPFGNYTCCPAMRVVGEDLELMFPIRSYTPEMNGFLATGGDYKGIGKEARRLYDMLRADQGFGKNDVTILVSCVNRRIGELITGITLGMEAEIFKEGLSSTQVIGFLAPGEMAFTHLMQEPYSHAFSCWGITLHSKMDTKENAAKHQEKEKADMGIRSWIRGKKGRSD